MSAPSETAEPFDSLLFGRNARGLRVLQRLTQGELAKRSGVSLTTVYSAEKGVRLRTSTLKKIAEGLNTNFDSLAYRTLKIKDSERAHVMHSMEETIWFGETDQRRQIPADNHERIQDPAERMRLGRVGLVPSFRVNPDRVVWQTAWHPEPPRVSGLGPLLSKGPCLGHDP
jgi:transcriptional regulator with XRE-family HTH domain